MVRSSFFFVPILIIIICPWTSFGPTAVMADSFELAPVVAEDSWADAPAEDSVLPVLGGKTTRSSSTGFIQNDLKDSIPFHVKDQGRPGAQAQFRGLGGSPEDIDVQMLGIPLTAPQGGGFNLADFPQFIWSDYRLQLGTSVFDPRGVSGVLNLRPWTSRALAGPVGKVGGQGSFLLSDAGLRQVAVGAVVPQQAAAVVGMSDGDAQGPSGMITWTGGDERRSFQFHLLGTRLDVQNRGTLARPSPRAHQLTARLLPIVQLDSKLSEGWVLQNNFYYDGTYLRYEDPDRGEITGDQVRAGGTENTLYWGAWKFRLGAKRVDYHGIGFVAPTENALTAQTSRTFEADGMTIEPSLQLSGVSHFAWMPAASLGLRRSFSNAAGFLRLSYSPRFPSLIDRYYRGNEGIFQANPALQVERDWTGIVGVERTGGSFWGSLEAYAQLKEDAQVATSAGGVRSVANEGKAWVAALTGQAGLALAPGISLVNAATLARSRIFLTGSSFPYMPEIINILSIKTVSVRDPRAWSAQGSWRMSSGAAADYTGSSRISGYGYLDLEGSYRIRQILFSGRIENVFDRAIEFDKGFPTTGRSVSLLVSGEI